MVSNSPKDIYSILNISPDKKSTYQYGAPYSGHINSDQNIDDGEPSGSIFDNYRNYPPDPENYWMRFRILTFVGLATVLCPLIYLMMPDWDSFKSNSHFATSNSESVTGKFNFVFPDIVQEQSEPIVEEEDLSLESMVLRSPSENVNGLQCHFYKGNFSYKSQSWPIALVFIEGDSGLTHAVYKNLQAGTIVEMDLNTTNNLTLTGGDFNEFVISFEESDYDTLTGFAVNGGMKLSVAASPTKETFSFPISSSYGAATKGMPVRGRAANDYPDYYIGTDYDWVYYASPDIDTSHGSFLMAEGNISGHYLNMDLILLDNGQITGRYYNSNGITLDFNGYIDSSNGILYVKLGHGSELSKWRMWPVSSDPKNGVYTYEGVWGKAEKPSEITFRIIPN